jgi:hypothetical protein
MYSSPAAERPLQEEYIGGFGLDDASFVLVGLELEAFSFLSSLAKESTCELTISRSNLVGPPSFHTC